MTHDAEQEIKFPPSIPDGELTIIADARFIGDCREQVESLLKDCTIEPVGMTSSPEWGTVFRMDYALPGQDISLSRHRIVFWRKAGLQKIDFVFYWGFAAGAE